MVPPGFLKHQLMLWALGRARQQAPVILPYLRVGLLSLTAAIAGGLLFTLSCVGLLAAFYLYLGHEGIAPAPACLITSAVTFVLTGVVFNLAYRMIKQRFENVRTAEIPLANAPITVEEVLTDLPRMMVTNFLHGVMGEDSSACSRTTRPH